MNRRLLALMIVVGILLAGSLGFSGTPMPPLLAPGDPDDDNDGIPNAIDQCPTVDASFFDRNGDGCIDDAAGARHTEFWTKAQLPFRYYINENGAPGITDGSDFTAVQSGISAWTLIPHVVFSVSYEGTSTLKDAAANDGINLVTFRTSQKAWTSYHAATVVIALGISFSYNEPTMVGGTYYRAGQIVDADLIFNPNRYFKTSTAGASGADVRDIQSVVTHEAGHLFGISHSPVFTSTMFYVLPPGTNARSLSSEDQEVFLKAYGDSAYVADANRIAGTVLNGRTNDPVPGAIVYAIDSSSGDTIAADFSLPDGSYAFPGIADGSYYIAIHPIDQSKETGGFSTENINALVDSTAEKDFSAEYYDQNESSSDDPTDKLAVAVSGGSKATGIDIITNIDTTPPEVASITPQENATAVKIDAAIKIRFSESIDYETVGHNFELRNAASRDKIAGTASFFNHDSTVAFTPMEPLDFGTAYELTLGTGITDIQHNELEQPYVLDFATQPMPALSITSLAPSKGVVGSLVVISGYGFSRTGSANHVFLGNTEIPIIDAFRGRLLVKIPMGAKTDYITVSIGENVSNELTFTVLSQEEVAKGFETGVTELTATPNAVCVLPDSAYAYVATSEGVDAVSIDPGNSRYLTVTPIDEPGGIDDVCPTPRGDWVYGISKANGRLYAIDANPLHGNPPIGSFNTVIWERSLDAAPIGILIEPNGRKAYIPTDGGGIQVWDVKTDSDTYKEQIGLIAAPDAGVRGKMAIDPTGRYLLILSGTGKLYIYDAGPDTLYATATVLSDPQDVVVDPTGQHAYVSDGTGYVSIVPLSGLFAKTYDISTGGSLRGMTITPAGHYLYACNRYLNLIDVIDINEEGAKARSVVATIELEQPAPVDIDLSPDGFYAFTAAQGTKQLVVTTIGLGPTLRSLSRRAGCPGTKLVLAGSGFGTILANIRVVFPSAVLEVPPTEVEPEYSSGTSLTVTVPSGAATGALKVKVIDSSGPTPVAQMSNALYFEALGTGTPPGSLRCAGRIGTQIGYAVNPALELSPTGDFLVIGGYQTGSGGILGIFDTDPESATFNQWINTFGTGTQPAEYLALTPDGERAYIAGANYGTIQCQNVNRHSGSFGMAMGTIDLSGRITGTYQHLCVSPDGELLLALTTDSLYVINIVPGSTSEGKVIGAFVLHAPLLSATTDIAFHPGGRYAYFVDATYEGEARISVLCLDPTSPSYMTIVASTIIFHDPDSYPLVHSLAFEPNGHRCLALVRWRSIFTNGWDIYTYNTDDPAHPVSAGTYALGCFTGMSELGAIDVSPRGDRVIAAVGKCGFINLDLTTDPFTEVGRVNDTTLAQVSGVDFDFTPDGSRLYVAGPSLDSLFVYDFPRAAAGIYMVGGNEQAGTINEALAVPLRVQCAIPDSANIGLPGIAIEFDVTSGGGYFTKSHLTRQMVATDANGYAEIYWTLGPPVGVQTQRVQASSYGLNPGTLHFIADAYDLPENLPLRLSQTIPVLTATNVSVTSSVQATFSTGVDPASITDASFFVAKQANPVPIVVTQGFSDKDRKVALIPKSALEYNTSYVITATSAVVTPIDSHLTNPGTYQFTTGPKPPLVLASISPPAASVGAAVVLSGQGFDADASADKVLFTGAETVPTQAGVDYMTAVVPLDAIPGTVRVVCGSDTSNAIPFVVLVPSTSLVDEVLATVTTTSTVKSVAVTPDGALAYAVSPDGGIVIPIDVDGQSTYSSIAVGDRPVAIDIDPEGRYAYVANFESGTVSVIVVDPDSTRFNKVVETILVGTGPMDVAVNPDGDRVYVANAGSMSVSVIDGDWQSATCHQVLATVTTTTTVKSVAVTPDGSTVYAGTDVGYVIIDAQANAVTATINVSNSIKSVAVTPDGAFLIALTTENKVLVIDIMEGSSTVNTVLATITTATTVKSVAVSPDGALLYLILDNTDRAFVYKLTVIGSSSVLDPRASIPPPIVQLAPVDTIPTGRDPAGIAFDPSGSGLVLICNAGDNSITFLNATGLPPGPIVPQIQVRPRTLNLQSNGRWVTGRIELPIQYWPEEIVVGSVLLQGGIHAAPGLQEIEDSDNDGLRELVLKFDRAAFQAILPQGEYVPVTITGTVRNRRFAGADTIRTIRPVVTHPNGGVLTPGVPTTITWTSPAGYHVDSVSVHWSPDDGASWIALAHGIPDAESLPWQVPSAICEHCRIMVTLFSHGEILGMGMSQDAFMINVAIAVTVQEFSGAIADGAAVLAWRTALEQNVEGFNLLRSEKEDGEYAAVNARLIPSRGSSGGAYDFKDETVALNRTYYYKLEEVSERGSKIVFGPYTLVARAPFALGQNAPNPFNPVTTIKFTVPEDAFVTLIVYDASGRRVRTLVNEPLQANFYKVQWNGRNDDGRQAASGVYFYRLHAGRHAQARKMLLLR